MEAKEVGRCADRFAEVGSTVYEARKEKVLVMPTYLKVIKSNQVACNNTSPSHFYTLLPTRHGRKVSAALGHTGPYMNNRWREKSIASFL